MNKSGNYTFLCSLAATCVVVCGIVVGIHWFVGYMLGHGWTPRYREGQLVQSVQDREPGQVIHPMGAKGIYAVRFADNKQAIVYVNEFEIEPTQAPEKQGQ